MCSRAAISPSMSTPATPHPTLWVCAAVLVERGRVMLTRRPAGGANAGAWEFPGGKVEPGEAPRAALARELLEELALPVAVGDVLEVAFVEREEGALALLFFEVARKRPLVAPQPLQVAASSGLGWTPCRWGS